MFKVSSAVRLLLSSGGASVKLFTHNSGIRTAVALQLKEIQVNKINDKLIIEGVRVSSPRAEHLIQNNSKCCAMCNLDLDVKHTDVLILSQFVRPDGCMMPRRITGLCNTQQKRMSKLVSMAHKAGLMSSLAPENSKRDPSRRKCWKKYNTYFDESTIKVHEPHFLKIRNDIILNYMQSKYQGKK